MNWYEISVIVCTYNRAGMLAQCLDSLMMQVTHGRFRYEIVIIDDNSTDETQEVVTAISERSSIPMRYIKESGVGIASARNRGLRESNSEWVAFFDDDQLAEPNWLATLYTMAVNAGICCVGGARLLHLSEEKLAELSPVCRRILGEVYLGTQDRKCRRKEFPAAGNILLKRTVFKVIGTFNDALVRGGEDIDLAQRFRLAGLEAWYAAKAIAFHMIPEYRMKEAYYLWSSLRAGDNFAYRDYLEWGLTRTLMASVARGFQAVFINLPLWGLAIITKNASERIGRKCLLFRAKSYSMQSLHLIAPRIFAFKRFFKSLEFRGERLHFAR